VAVLGAGSFGTALAVVLSRAGVRTTLCCRSEEQGRDLSERRENLRYLPGVRFPPGLTVAPAPAEIGRAELVIVAVPARALPAVVEALQPRWESRPFSVVSAAKGLCDGEGTVGSTLLSRAFGADRTACLGGPSHARELVGPGGALVCASTAAGLARTVAGLFAAAGLVCEISNDPIGVELAGTAKNAAALAAGATQSQGLNAAGAAAGHIFSEVWRYAAAKGARPESFIGLAGSGDLVATALAPQSRNRRAGELLAQGVAAGEIPQRIGQAVEALQSVSYLAAALKGAGVEAPVLTALAGLVAGELPLERWLELVRTTTPPPALFPRRGWLRRLKAKVLRRRL
jgi:glycerol-3-phosphate dehydrogenase (NAD(P)+)